MNTLLFKKLCIAFILFCIQLGFSQTKDTIIDVGKYNLHFTIIEGQGTPILFESGSGNDASVWKDIIQPIADITGTTIITYDRAGLGKSKIKSSEDKVENNGIIDNVIALETGLDLLGYNKDIILVAHSLGGLYTTLFSSRNEKKVKSVVFIDASLASFYTETFVNKLNGVISENFLTKLKTEKIGLYYEIKNIKNSIKLLRNTNFPTTIPLIDLVASNPYNPFKDEIDKERWIGEHKKFSAISNRELVLVNDAQHYFFKNKTTLVISAIIKSYALSLKEFENKQLLINNLDFAIKTANQTTN
jgi:hypothetical protein